jgi:hypothetical protein
MSETENEEKKQKKLESVFSGKHGLKWLNKLQ